MLLWAVIRLALRTLMSNKIRTFLTMLGIIIGVAAVIAMISLGEGAKMQVSRTIEGLGSNLLIVSPGQKKFRHVRTGIEETLTIEDAAAIEKEIPLIKSISPEIFQVEQVKYGNKNSNTSVLGTAPEYINIRNFKIKEGRFFNKEDVNFLRRVAVLGDTVKNDLFGEGTPIGKFIKIRGTNFQVIGVLEAKGQTTWFNPDDQILIPISTALKRLFGVTYVRSISLQAVSMDRLEDAAREVEKLLLKRHRIAKGEEPDFNVRTQLEMLSSMREITKTFTYLLGGIASVSLLVGGIGIMNIMLVSVTERTREIGIRKAIGAKNKYILKQFLIESVIICLIGGIIGIGLGIAISWIISSLGEWKTVVAPYSIILAFAFSIAVGIFFGLYPARRAAMLDPIKALHYE
jgi:putative ABC transport system permease protein